MGAKNYKIHKIYNIFGKIWPLFQGSQELLNLRLSPRQKLLKSLRHSTPCSSLQSRLGQLNGRLLGIHLFPLAGAPDGKKFFDHSY